MAFQPFSFQRPWQQAIKQQVTKLTSPRFFPLLVVLGLILRVTAALVSRGYYHPDEYFNYLEPAFQWAFPEYKHRFDASLDMSYRSYLIIGLHYLVLKLLKATNLFTPTLAQTALKTMMACLSMGLVAVGIRLTTVYRDQATARLVGLMLLFWYYFIFFAPHFLSENYASLFSLVGFYFLARFEKNTPSASPHRSLFAFGCWMALATQFRLQSAFFMLYPFAYLAVQRRFKLAVSLAAGFWLPTLFFGLSEVFYKGAPFATLTAYYQINIGRQALIFSYPSPWYQYIANLNFQFGEWFFPFLIYFAARGFYRVMPLAGGSCLVYFVIHCLFPHKEVRFLFPITPLLLIAFCLGLQHWYATTRLNQARKQMLLAALGVCLLTAQAFHVSHSLWRGNISGPACTLLSQAGQLPQAQHIVLVERGYHCGYVALGRDIPLSRVGPQPDTAGTIAALAAIDWQAYPEHWVIVEQNRLPELTAALQGLAYEASAPTLTLGPLSLLRVRGEPRAF